MSRYWPGSFGTWNIRSLYWACSLVRRMLLASKGQVHLLRGILGAGKR